MFVSGGKSITWHGLKMHLQWKIISEYPQWFKGDVRFLSNGFTIQIIQRAETTFTFYLSILTLSNAFRSINNREMKSESGLSLAMASQPFHFNATMDFDSPKYLMFQRWFQIESWNLMQGKYQIRMFQFGTSKMGNRRKNGGRAIQRL